MVIVSQYNVSDLDYEVVNVNPKIPVSFGYEGGRFDVKLGDDGVLNIYYISVNGMDRLYVSAQTGNVLNVIPLNTL